MGNSPDRDRARSSRGDGAGVQPSDGWWERSAFVPSRNLLVVGAVVLLLAVAGCGGNGQDETQRPTAGTDVVAANGTNDGNGIDGGGETTTGVATEGPAMDGSSATTGSELSTTTGGSQSIAFANGSTPRSPNGTGSGAPSESRGVFSSAVAAGSTGAAAGTSGGRSAGSTDNGTLANVGANRTGGDVGAGVDSVAGSGGLTVAIEPTTAHTNDARLGIYYAVGPRSATTGLERITVRTGGGLDASDVTVANVDTVGIDAGSDQPGSRTNGPSLASNVGRGIGPTADGNGLVVPLDEQRALDRTDELVIVLDGGVRTTTSGTYTFSLSINGGPTQTVNYTITRRT